MADRPGRLPLIEPMLATPARVVPRNETEWGAEAKWEQVGSWPRSAAGRSCCGGVAAGMSPVAIPRSPPLWAARPGGGR
jgi:hypothetical protein